MSELESYIYLIFVLFLPVGLFFFAMVSFIIGMLLKLLKSIKYKKWNKIGTIWFTISMIVYFLFIVLGFINN